MFSIIRYKHIALLIISLHTLIGCSSNDGTTDDNADEQRVISWEACIDNVLLDCGTLQVPVDYQFPENNSISIALVRKEASGDSRKGILLFNPGGPGGSGTELIKEVYAELPKELTDNFDLIGFDPRGVADSDGLICADAITDEIDPYPVDTEAVLNVLSDLRLANDTCYEKYGNLLQHLGSNNVARDMDEIRKALNESKLNFIGYSYGTRLASLYLELFPEHAGRLVLDASLPPTGTITQLIQGQLQQMQVNFEAWLAGCTAIDNSCDPAALQTRVVDRLNTLIANSNEIGPDAEAAEEEAELLGNLLLFSTQEPDVGELTLEPLVAYMQGFNTLELLPLLNLLTLLEGQDEQSTYSDLALETAVLCSDDPTRPTNDEIVGLLEEYNSTSDLFAEAHIAMVALCNSFVASVDPVLPLSVISNNQAIVIGGVADPATPLVWSEAMAEAIGSPLIVSEHVGHTIALTGKSSCVDDQVINFLLEGTVPERLACPVNQD